MGTAGTTEPEWPAVDENDLGALRVMRSRIIGRDAPRRHGPRVLYLRLWGTLPVIDYLAGALPGMADALDADMAAARKAYRKWLAGAGCDSHMPAERENMCRAWTADFAAGWGRDCWRLLTAGVLPASGELPSRQMTYAAHWYATQAVSLRAAELTAGAAVLAITAGQPATPMTDA